MDPAVFRLPVVPDPVSVLHGTAVLDRFLDLFPEGTAVVRVHSHVFRLFLHISDVFFRIPHDLIESRVVEDRPNPGSVIAVYTKPAGDTAECVLKLFFQDS